MGGFFGVISKEDCVANLFYGTDYHSHLGTRRGGLAVLGDSGFTRFIKDITVAQFRSKFDEDIHKMQGRSGIGVISDYEDQPLLIGSHLGTYAIVTVGAVNNAQDLVRKAFAARNTHFSEMSGNEINQTEVVATLINQEKTYAAGIRRVQEQVDGSCSLILLTSSGLIVARDRLGRTPVALGRGPNGYAVSSESCAFPNLGFVHERDLGPGEIIHLTAEGVEVLSRPGAQMQICSFLWIYYGYPPTTYEGINVELARYRCGAALARNDSVKADIVAGIPDSGTGHAIGYAREAKVPYGRPFTKYTPTWPRSFMPQIQSMRELVAKMKLIPIPELVKGARIVFCEDSIVRGTQLRDTLQRIYDFGAREIHMRPACPPLLFGCKFLRFSRSASDMDLAARRAVAEIEGRADAPLEDYVDDASDKYQAMVQHIGRTIGVTSLRYQRLGDMVKAIGLPKSKLCTYCWDGCERAGRCRNVKD